MYRDLEFPSLVNKILSHGATYLLFSLFFSFAIIDLQGLIIFLKLTYDLNSKLLLFFKVKF